MVLRTYTYLVRKLCSIRKERWHVLISDKINYKTKKARQLVEQADCAPTGVQPLTHTVGGEGAFRGRFAHKK